MAEMSSPIRCEGGPVDSGALGSVGENLSLQNNFVACGCDNGSRVVLLSLSRVFCVAILLCGYENSADGLRMSAKRRRRDSREVFMLFFFGSIDGWRKVGDERCFERELN